MWTQLKRNVRKTNIARKFSQAVLQLIREEVTKNTDKLKKIFNM